VHAQALTAAERLLARQGTDQERIVELYRLVLGREPRKEEVERLERFLASSETQHASWDEPRTSGPAGATAVASQPIVPEAVPANPDQMVQTDEPVVEAVVEPGSARAAAWQAAVQAVLGSAEFRYVR
jgi:hypothetical protein